MSAISTNQILKDANTLRQTALQKKQIGVSVKETLTHLSDLIHQAHENGHGYIESRLPMQFAIDGMSFSKMQQHVWCQVIDALEQRNYKVALDPMETECIIFIQWESDEDKAETRHQLEILAKHTIRSKKRLSEMN